MPQSLSLTKHISNLLLQYRYQGIQKMKDIASIRQIENFDYPMLGGDFMIVVPTLFDSHPRLNITNRRACKPPYRRFVTAPFSPPFLTITILLISHVTALLSLRLDNASAPVRKTRCGLLRTKNTLEGDANVLPTVISPSLDIIQIPYTRWREICTYVAGAAHADR